MVAFEPLPAIVGGAMIGLAASLLLLTTGRIAGISGILNGALDPGKADRWWRWLFVAGLAGGAALAMPLASAASLARTGLSWPLVAAAGLLVGFGTRVGSGCTSGHGVCGIARLSPRSIVATLTFIAAGILTVYVRRWLGGAWW